MTRDDPAAFAPPPAFGPFRVLHQIGIGALGPVFRTYEPTRDRLVAVKVFRLDVTPEQSQSLADELARAADAGLFHPSIVEPVAAGVEGMTAYRAEEYVAAESLDVAMRHYAPAPVDQALPFLTQLAGAIDFARAAGVGHGALHLRDVFVTPDEARASGFGIVEALERVGVRAPVRRPYTAPERIAGGEWSTPADVFSLAAIAYELLTGRRPSGTGEQIGDLSGENFGSHASAIRSVLARAMHDDAARRYATALGFASALESAARTGTVDGAVVAVPQVATEPSPPSPSVIAIDAQPSSTTVMATDSARPSPPAPQPTPALAVVKPTVPPVVAAAPIEKLQDGTATPEVRGKEDARVKQELPAKKAEAIEGEEVDDDVAAERETDTAHHRLMADYEEDTEPTLFDEGDEEYVEDLGLESIGLAANESTRWDSDSREAVAPGSDDLRAPRRDERTFAPTFGSTRPVDEVPTTLETPRASLVPMGLIAILCLLLGYGLGWWRYSEGGVETTAPPAQPVAETARPNPPTKAADTPQPGRAYSEQTVAPHPTATAPRSGEPPPIPGDAPGADTAAVRKPSASASANKSARLTIISTPTRAVVTINGRWRGRTPLTLDTLPFGSYTVRVVQPGFTPSNEDVVLSARQSMRTLSVHLQPLSVRGPSAPAARPAEHPANSARESASSGYAGTIFVDSRPRGAKVIIDGKPMGTTPASIPGIPIGSHVVRLELEDHRVWTTSTSVSAGEQARVTGSLERIR